MWERYWDRKVWGLEAQVLTNPMLGMGSDSEESDGLRVDATTDDGIETLVGLGLPIKKVSGSGL